MILEPTEDQEFFRATTARYLDDQAPPAELRRLRDDPAGFEVAYWQGGAELGWTSLLVGEAHGGGSISGSPVEDVTLIASEFGRHAAPGPFVPTNLVAAALSAAGDPHPPVLAGLLSGATIATWCPPTDRVTVAVNGDELVLNGVARPVESAARAEWLLATGQHDDSSTQVLVPADAPGVSIRAMKTVDLTRRFDEVGFEDVRLPLDAVVGEVGAARSAVERQVELGSVMVNAESVGTLQRAFDMTVEWAMDRYSFGRPLASYQALKHRFAEMKMWLEASHAISDAAASAVAGSRPDRSELISAALAYVGQYGSDLMQECVQLHGGIGVTFEHDLHLYLRRHTLDRTLFGTPTVHRRRLGQLALIAEGAA